MKTITTRIPNKENKRDYILLHIDTYRSLLEYLVELPEWVSQGGLEDWVSAIYKELEGLRRL